jgi:hypothetical protein
VAIKVIYSHGIKVFYAGVVFESLWYSFYRILGCKIEKPPMLFSNTPKKVAIFKNTIIFKK